MRKLTRDTLLVCLSSCDDATLIKYVAQMECLLVCDGDISCTQLADGILCAPCQARKEQAKAEEE